MQATLQFDTVETALAGAPLAASWHVAWYVPEHHIVEPVAEFFAERFASMRWALLTPERCARWDRERLLYAGGASLDEDATPSAVAALWRRVAASFDAAGAAVSAKSCRPVASAPPQDRGRDRTDQPDPATEQPGVARRPAASAGPVPRMPPRRAPRPRGCRARGRAVRGSCSSASSRATRKT